MYNYICAYIIFSTISNSIVSETAMFTKVFKIILCHAVLVILLMFSRIFVDFH